MSRDELLEISETLRGMRIKMASNTTNPQHLSKEGLALHAAITIIEHLAQTIHLVKHRWRFEA